jgi:hypothetical protein
LLAHLTPPQAAEKENSAVDCQQQQLLQTQQWENSGNEGLAAGFTMFGP